MARSDGIVLQLVYKCGKTVDVDLRPGAAIPEGVKKTKRGHLAAGRRRDADKPAGGLEGFFADTPCGLYSLDTVREGLAALEREAATAGEEERKVLLDRRDKVSSILSNSMAMDPGE